jgi:hypothetical protein
MVRTQEVRDSRVTESHAELQQEQVQEQGRRGLGAGEATYSRKRWPGLKKPGIERKRRKEMKRRVGGGQFTVGSDGQDSRSQG